MYKEFKTSILMISMLPMFLPSAYSVFPADDTPYGIRATHPALNKKNNLKIPLAAPDGKIPTLNRTGFMTPDKNFYIEEFILCSAASEAPVLDVGAAYGVATLPALENGATVIANDIDPRHLLLLRKRTPPGLRKSLILNNRHFPDDITFPEESLRAILVCRVAHFLTGTQMDRALGKMRNWLMPRGRIFIVTMSPRHHLLKDSFLPMYETRIRKEQKWPGEVNNMHRVAPILSGQIPEFLHVMDERSLRPAVQNWGFHIVHEGSFDYTRPDAIPSGGRGYYGIIAEKSG